MSELSLDGRVALVLGASSGIGEEIGRALNREGCTVVLAARRVDRCKAILDELANECDAKCDAGDKPKESMAVKCDATKKDEVRALYETIMNKYGKIDIVVNTAGVMYFTLTKNGFWDEWEQTVDVNCKGTMFSCGAAVPHMIKQKCGHIVNISSDAARQTFPALTVYNASKSFVHEFSKGLRCELIGTGVRVTELQPGDIRTDLIVKNKDKEAVEKVGVGAGAVIGGTNFKETVAKEVAEAKAEGNAKGSATRNCYLDTVDIANAVLYALRAPGHVGVNEILIEPRDQTFGDPTSMDCGADAPGELGVDVGVSVSCCG